jgi:putative transposase
MKINLNKNFRRKGFDYGSNGFYFITIKCKNRICYLGGIENEEFIPSTIGQTAINNWENIPKHFPFILLDEFQCMPDHFHGIIQVNKEEFKFNKEGNKFGPQKDNIGVVISNFKASVTRFANQNQIEFKWHSRYHDSIIDGVDQLQNIRNYIKNNPKNWKK